MSGEGERGSAAYSSSRPAAAPPSCAREAIVGERPAARGGGGPAGRTTDAWAFSKREEAPSMFPAQAGLPHGQQKRAVGR